ncbi:hypothetical protein QO034_17380 [Sedimentitalea sp. JM2-8]|uniref:Fusaric acid resistance protein-like n=2 Tax=Sedimentitalea xiamensis TaxID=3050037 RepID=A0ABT7FIF3_9RHOB|nr:hypothetical protein [Sedimentitalea xiamensis]
MGRPPAPYLAILSLAIALASLLLWPDIAGLWFFAALLAAGAGIESRVIGGRAFVAALYGWLSILLIPAMPPIGAALPWLLIGLAWGLVAARLLNLTAIAAPPPSGAGFAVGLVIFLLAGLSAALVLTEKIGSPFGHWLVLLFVVRALTPQGRTIRAALRFGAGAAVGCALALFMTPFDLPDGIPLLLAVCLLLLGLRYLPHPLPLAPAAITAAVLLGTAPGQDAALFRLEAALIAVALTLATGIAIGLVWRLLPFPASPSPDPPG